MNKEDEKALGTLAGLTFVLSPEEYTKYKKSLNEQLEEKDKEIERLNKLRNEDNEKSAKIIMKMTTEIDRLNNIINRGIELLEPFVEIDMCVIKGKMIKPALDKLKELKDKNE